VVSPTVVSPTAASPTVASPTGALALVVPRVLDRVYYGNPLGAWLLALTIFVAGGLVLVLVRRLLIGRLERFATRTSTIADDVALGMLRRTRVVFLFLLALEVAVHAALALPPAWDRAVHLVGELAALLQGASWVNGAISLWLDRMARRTGEFDKSSLTTLNVLGVVLRVVMWTLIFLLALQAFDIDVTALITGLGIAGVAVALAVQNILGDLFASLTIALDKPFVIGDTITVDQLTGTVEDIGLKTTRVRALTGELLVFSNTDLLKARIRNYRGQVQRRVTFTIGVDYAASPEQVERVPKIIAEAITAENLLRLDRSHLSSLADAALVFETVYYVSTADYTAYMDAQQRVYLTLLRRFAADGIKLAAPARTTVVVTSQPDGARAPAVIEQAGS
jgi:small-conductance mechanosensitive channel